MANQTFQADEWLNELSDRDEVWGPLLFMRPERHQAFGVGRVAVLSAILGGFYGLFGDIVGALLLRGGAKLPSPWSLPVAFIGAFFISIACTLAAAWNRRARLISRREAWSRETTRR